MAKEKDVKITTKWDCGKMSTGSTAGGGAVYGFGFLGALIYFLSHANSFWNGVLGILKAIVWPGYIVFELLKFLSIK